MTDKNINQIVDEFKSFLFKKDKKGKYILIQNDDYNTDKFILVRFQRLKKSLSGNCISKKKVEEIYENWHLELLNKYRKPTGGEVIHNFKIATNDDVEELKQKLLGEFEE